MSIVSFIMNILSPEISGAALDNGIEKAGGVVKKRIDENELRNKVTSQLEKYLEGHQAGIELKDEFDYQALLDGRTQLIERAKKCVVGPERDIKRKEYFEFGYAVTGVDPEERNLVLEAVLASVLNTVLENDQDVVTMKAVDELLLHINRLATKDSVKNLENKIDNIDEKLSKAIPQEITYKEGIDRSKLEKAVEHESKTPVINIFHEKMTWKTMFEKELYQTQSFTVKKDGFEEKIYGADELFRKYKQLNLLITGEAGFGKTATLEYLFLKYALTDETPVYYLPAYVFIRAKDEITHLQKAIRNAIENGEQLEGLFLIDGFEESFIDNYHIASVKIKMLEDSGIHFWIACRPDFYANLNVETDGCFDGVAYVTPWQEKDFDEFVFKYEQNFNQPGLLNRTKELRRNSVMETTSICRPLFAILFIFLATGDEDESANSLNPVIRNEYDLIELFIIQWFKRESKREGRLYILEDYYPVLRELAFGVYESKRPVLNLKENVVKDLVIVSRNRSKPFVEKFCHREFCIFFIAESIISGTQKGDLELIQSLSHLHYDDVTNLCKVGIRNCGRKAVKNMYENMFRVYRQTYEMQEDMLSVEAKNAIRELDELGLLSLRDEIIYYITKLPEVEKICKGFLDYAVSHINGDIMISLGIAYSAATIMYHSHVLAFARKLTPGTPEELRNRSWALAFFRDVFDENGYTYVDDGNGKWINVKKARWKRLIINRPEYYRSRILDIPLLYCFYYSRQFRDCNSVEDLAVIEACDITNYDYTDEERAFLIEQKRKLVEAYRANLKLVAEQDARSVASADADKVCQDK